jgi:hypothetical protein
LVSVLESRDKEKRPMREARTVVLLTGAVTGREFACLVSSPDIQPRLHFNWGYHEAAQDWKSQRPKRSEFSKCGKTLGAVKAYAAGYEYGWQDAFNHVYLNDADEAWMTHTTQAGNN